MEPKQAIKNLVSGRNEADVRAVAEAVASASKRGSRYDGPNSTHVEDWIAEGQFTGNETVEGLAAEWDE
jgi:hypothetical protein